MTFKWEKKGQIFDPNGRAQWMNNYAQNPNALILEDRIRIYFTTRPVREPDGGFVSRTGYADFEKNEPFNFIEIGEKPVLELGGPGDFDEFGIMPGSILHIPERNEVWLYYVGWTRMSSVPYKWTIGLAISKDGGKTFSRYSKGPIIGSQFNDPYLHACPRVTRLAPDNWIMWYQAGVEWNFVDDHFESVYITKMATSKDGIHWDRIEEQVVPSVVDKECQTSASVFKIGEKYHMWFSYRYGIGFRSKEKGYRIGYASSDDMMKWTRDDSKSGIDVSEMDWDSEMICYPHVFELNSKVYMLYCGNYFGRDGFGYAVLKQ